jgi:protocatechuate 3,4-dioxygenase beta subunit
MFIVTICIWPVYQVQGSICLNNLKKARFTRKFELQFNLMQKIFLLAVFSIAFTFWSCSQNNSRANNTKQTANKEKIGGRCEGCEAIYECPLEFSKLLAADTLPDFNESGPKIMISGIVYQRDGKTPAKDVVIYVYHTDQTGHYTPGPNPQGWEKRHGRIRGWMKTDQNGSYKFYTLRPAHYPEGTAVEHIHVTIKEPDKNEYWVSEYLFDDDPLLTPEKRKMDEKRGGTGIVKLIPGANGIAHATRDLILGLNIPDYPVK